MLSPNNTFTYHRKTISLAKLLLVSHLSLAAIAIFAFAIAMFIMTYRATYRQAEGELLGAAESMAQDLRSGIRPMDLTVPEAFLHRFGKAPRDQAYWVVWDGEGKQLAAEGNPQHAIAMSDVVPKRSGPRPFVTRTSGRILELIIATSDDGQLLVGRPLAKEFDAMGRMFIRLAGFSMLGLIASGLVAWWMSGRISKPIIELSQHAKQFTQYQLDKRLAINQPTREMSELAVAFNSMIENLEQAFDQQSQFTSDAAHELRTPVSVILSQSEYSLSRDRSADDYRNGLESCQQAALHMKQLVENLLDISRCDSAQISLQKQPLDLSNIAGEVIQWISPLAETRQIRITTDLSPTMIVGDATRLRQVVLNLLSNAIEYNVDGGKIMVLVASNQSEAVIEVIDRGMGISAEDLPLVQNRFFRVDQARTFDGSNGAGLGLSLVAEFVRLHGGTVDIQSQLGEGTVVRIVFPKLDASGVR